MKKSVFRNLLPMGMALLLSACSGPRTPQEVTQAFWTAVVNGDPEGAVEYSTLADPRNYDGFSKDWRGYQPSWGKIIIDGNEASVVSKFASPEDPDLDERKFVTYLVRRNGQWLVDYDRTGREARGGALANLFETLSNLSGDFSNQFESSANDFNAQMESMSRELEQLYDEFGQQVFEGIEKYSEQLRKNIRKLEESINRALNEEKGTLSKEDSQVLKEIATELDENNEKLADPTVESIATSSRKLGDAQLKLDSLESDSLVNYRKQWQELFAQFEEDLQKVLEKLSASGEAYSDK